MSEAPNHHAQSCNQEAVGCKKNGLSILQMREFAWNYIHTTLHVGLLPCKLVRLSDMWCGDVSTFPQIVVGGLHGEKPISPCVCIMYTRGNKVSSSQRDLYTPPLLSHILSLSRFCEDFVRQHHLGFCNSLPPVLLSLKSAARLVSRKPVTCFITI